MLDSITSPLAPGLTGFQRIGQETEGSLRFCTQSSFSISLNWLREVSRGVVDGDLGLVLGPPGRVLVEMTLTGTHRRELSLDESGNLRLKVFAAGARVPKLTLGVNVVDWSPDAALGTAGAPGPLRHLIRGAVVAGLRRKLERNLGMSLMSPGEQALADYSFNSNEEGLALARRAWEGDFTWDSGRASGESLASHGTQMWRACKDLLIELHLPFLDHKRWRSREVDLAGCSVSTGEDGRVEVCHQERRRDPVERSHHQGLVGLARALGLGSIHYGRGFSLSYSATRMLERAHAMHALRPVLSHYGFDAAEVDRLEVAISNEPGDAVAALNLSLPGSAFGDWAKAPSERAAEFFQVYSRVARAVQGAMRVWTPYLHFESPEAYEDTETAVPLIAFQASRPYFGRPKYDFTYDFLNEERMASFFRQVAPRFGVEMERIESMLRAAGRDRLAALYEPREKRRLLATLQRRPSMLQPLLAADARLVDAVVNLGCQASQLGRLKGSSPALVVRGLRKSIDQFVKAMNAKLRSLYAGRERMSLGSLLLLEATNALSGDGSRPQDIQAALRISWDEPGAGSCASVTLLNAASRLAT
jgi:hypothetical protein